jgi:helicase MOV-10
MYLERLCWIFIDIDASAENKFTIPPFRELMKYRVVVCSCVDAGVLAEAQCTNRTLMKLEDEIIGSIHPHSTRQTLAKPHWTHLIIDEVSVPILNRAVPHRRDM